MRLGDYELEAEIGRGGMGRVFRARHVPTGAARAVKVLEGAADPTITERFRREAQALARVGPGVAVPVHEVGSEAGRTFYAMDLMEGGSLSDRIGPARPALPWRDAAALVAKLARAVAQCHAAGLVHRDLKPENVLFDATGAARLADFGCARDLAASTLTVTGTSAGTPAYMSPEQLDGERGDARSDVYALGILLHELIAGERPFDAASWHEMLARKLKGGVLPIAERLEAPLELDAVLARTLEPSAKKRTPGAAELAGELEALATTPDRRRHGGSTAVALGVGALLLAGILAVTLVAAGRQPSGDPPRPEAPSPRASGPSSLALDGEIRERLRSGEALPGDLARVLAAPGGPALVHELATTPVVFPLERVREVAAAGASKNDILVLEAAAVIARSTDVDERRAATEALGRSGAEGPVRLADAAKAVSTLLPELSRMRATLFSDLAPAHALETGFKPIASRPDLVAAAIAPLASDCRFDILSGKTESGRQILNDVIRTTPGLEQSLERLPLAVAADYLRVTNSGDGAQRERDADRRKEQCVMMERLAVRLEDAKDLVLALQMDVLAFERRNRREPAFEPGRLAVERLGSACLGAPLASMERVFVHVCLYDAAMHWLQHVLVEARRGSGDERAALLEEADVAARLTLERARALRLDNERAVPFAVATDEAHILTATFLVLGRREEARAVGGLEGADPLRALLVEGATADSVAAACRPTDTKLAPFLQRARATIARVAERISTVGSAPDLEEKLPRDGRLEAPGVEDWLDARAVASVLLPGK